MLEKEFSYFDQNRDSLYKIYPDKFLVINGTEVKYASDTFEEALQYGSSTFGLGNFLVQKCTKTEKEQYQTFHSRVIFAK